MQKKILTKSLNKVQAIAKKALVKHFCNPIGYGKSPDRPDQNLVQIYFLLRPVFTCILAAVEPYPRATQ